MKKAYFLISTLTALYAKAQDSTGKMPPETTQPTSYWWWVIGVIITLAVGIALYRMIKRDPRKDG